MEACVDLGGPRANSLAIHRWWFLILVVVACRGVVPLPDSSVSLRCAQSSEVRKHDRRGIDLYQVMFNE